MSIEGYLRSCKIWGIAGDTFSVTQTKHHITYGMYSMWHRLWNLNGFVYETIACECSTCEIWLLFRMWYICIVYETWSCVHLRYMCCFAGDTYVFRRRYVGRYLRCIAYEKCCFTGVTERFRRRYICSTLRCLACACHSETCVPTDVSLRFKS